MGFEIWAGLGWGGGGWRWVQERAGLSSYDGTWPQGGAIGMSIEIRKGNRGVGLASWSRVVVALSAMAWPAGLAADGEGAPDFVREVRPILSEHCFACHGFDEHDRKAGLRLDTYEGATVGGRGGAAMVPGKPEESELIFRITTTDKGEVMPPPEVHKELSGEQIDILTRWVAGGGEYEEHWSYRPLVRPEVPEGEGREIDRFLARAQAEAGVEAVGTVDGEVLARRLALDLTGLPPAAEALRGVMAAWSGGDVESLTEALLASPHHGERMAMFWLDLVRYADTIGYHSDNPKEVSAYRDYVIGAFHSNKPYDQFTVEQLAGDLLEGATVEQRVASGYNRLLQTTQEGGAQAKEYLAIYAADRVRNVGEVWLGATLGCAQCHDHKYDPIRMSDFYRMAAFFADIKETAVGVQQPNLKLPTDGEEREMAELRERLAEGEVEEVLARDAGLAARVREGQLAWVGTMRAQLVGEEGWAVVVPERVESEGGSEFEVQEGGSVLVRGANPDRDVYRAVLKVTGRVAAVRLDALLHESMAQGRLSRANGNYVLTGFAARVGGEELAVAAAEADYEQPGFPVAAVLDGQAETGWAGNGHVEGVARAAKFVLAEPLEAGEGMELEVELRFESKHLKHQIGHFRLATSEAGGLALGGGLDAPEEILAALRADEGDEVAEAALAAYYRATAPELAGLRQEREGWEKRLAEVEAGVRTMLVAEAMASPREVRILDRGDWQDETGDVVLPGVPEFLAGEVGDEGDASGGRGTRLELAKWLVDESNPLTARTFVNRLWAMFFGRGISADLGDLGGQGVPPDHPELLDWLAVEFMESGWDVRHMVRLIVGSEAYRRSSVSPVELRQKDPGNRWLARQGRWRLDAELVRDVALAVSGLLVNEVGGMSVKPHQPAGYWAQLNFPQREWQMDGGDSVYRRGMYTFWCRTFPHPAMAAFDAPSREECVAKRARSNIPQQALVLLNDPSFVEAGIAFGARMMGAEGMAEGAGDRERLAWGCREVWGRGGLEEEIDVLEGLLEAQRARFAADEPAARTMISLAGRGVEGIEDVVGLAAWAQVARALMNSYEMSSRY
jgi:mono/diheme cytochrome c family protein